MIITLVLKLSFSLFLVPMFGHRILFVLNSTCHDHTATNIFANGDNLTEPSEQERACAAKAASCTLSQVILGKASWKR